MIKGPCGYVLVEMSSLQTQKEREWGVGLRSGNELSAIPRRSEPEKNKQTYAGRHQQKNTWVQPPRCNLFFFTSYMSGGGGGGTKKQTSHQNHPRVFRCCVRVYRHLNGHRVSSELAGRPPPSSRMTADIMLSMALASAKFSSV